MKHGTARFIYVGVRCNGAVKIGIAQFPEHRAHQLKIKLLGHWLGTWAEEQAIHKQLRTSRIVRHEWYADTPEVAAFILERTGHAVTTGHITSGAQIELHGQPTSVLFPVELRAFIKEAADSLGQPLAAFIRQAAKEYAEEVLRSKQLT